MKKLFPFVLTAFLPTLSFGFGTGAGVCTICPVAQAAGVVTESPPLFGFGTSGSPLTLDASSVTLQGNSISLAQLQTDIAALELELLDFLPLAGGTMTGTLLMSGDSYVEISSGGVVSSGILKGDFVPSLKINTNASPATGFGSSGATNIIAILNGEKRLTLTNSNLDWQRDGGNASFRTTRYQTNSGGPSFQGRKARGSVLTTLPVMDNDTLTSFDGRGWNGSAFALGARLLYRTTEDWDLTSNGTEVELRTTPNGSIISVASFKILEDGTLEINGNDITKLGNYPSLIAQLDDIAVSTSTPLNFLPLSGGTMAGNVIFTSGFIRFPAGEALQWKTFPGGNTVSVMNMYFDSFLIGQGATGGIPNPSAHARIIFGVNTKVGIATMTASGLDVDGAVTAISFDGDGSALTNLGKVDKAGDTMTGALILPTGTCSSNPSLRLDGGNAFKTGLCGGTGANGSLKFVAAGGLRLTIAGSAIFTGGQTFTANAIVSESGVDADSIAGYTLDGAGALDRLVNDLFIGRDFNEINLSTNTDAQGFNIVNVGSGSFIGPVSKGNQYLQVYDSAGGTNIDDSFTAIPWGSQTVVDSLYTHSTSVDNATVTINTSGLYKLSAVVAAEDASNDNSNIDVRIVVNGVQPSATSQVSCHGRKPAESIYTSCVFPPTIIAFTAADTVVIEARMAKPGTNWDTVAGRSWFNLELLRE